MKSSPWGTMFFPCASCDPPFFADSAVLGVPVRVRDRLAGGRGSGPTAGEEQEKDLEQAKNAGS